MAVLITLVVPILFTISFFALLIGIVVFFVEYLGARSIQDPVMRGAKKKRAWKWLLYPVYALVALGILEVILMLAGATTLQPAVP